MRASRKAALIAIIVGLGAFGYSQYAFATQITAVITDSTLLEETASGSTYDLEFEFDNPSLLILNAGQTEFTVMADDARIGDGTLEPFVLPAIDKTSVKGTFTVDAERDSKDGSQVVISGITKYDMVLTSIDVPFVYYPTAEQARAFIHQG